MKFLSRYKIDGWLIITLFLFIIISLISINSAQKLISNDTLVYKQLLWYIVGIIIICFIMFIKNDFIYKNIWFFYGIGIVSLLGLLLFADPINNAKCWFSVPGIGTI